MITIRLNRGGGAPIVSICAIGVMLLWMCICIRFRYMYTHSGGGLHGMRCVSMWVFNEAYGDDVGSYPLTIDCAQKTIKNPTNTLY